MPTSDKVKALKKKLLTKEKALERLAPFEGCNEKLVQGRTTFQIHPSKEDSFILGHGNEEFVLDIDVFTKLCRLVGVPHTYTAKIPHQLLFPHLQYWLNEGEMGVKLFSRGRRDKDGRTPIAGMARDDAYYYPVSRFLAKVDEVNPEYLVEGLEDVSWRNSTFGLVFPEFEFDVEEKDVQKGDFLYGGVKIKNSLLGEFPTKVSAFLLTLACLNGMVSVDEVYKAYNRKQGFDGQDEWVTDSVRQSIGALSAEVDKVRKLVDIKITNEGIPPYISHVFDQMGVNQKSREAVLTKLLERNPRNLYQLMNAITETAHSIENRGEVMALQSLGGFVASHAESCSKCRRPF